MNPRINKLIHFWTMFPIFIAPENTKKTKGFLVFSGGCKMGKLVRNALTMTTLNSDKAGLFEGSFFWGGRSN